MATCEWEGFVFQDCMFMYTTLDAQLFRQGAITLDCLNYFYVHSCGEFTPRPRRVADDVSTAFLGRGWGVNVEW